MEAPSGGAGGAHALDLASGTGDIAFALADAGADVVGTDVTLPMIEIAVEKARRRTHRAKFLVADMLALPFDDRSFDLATAGYGLRNVPDLRASIDEIHRVLKPGGLMLSLDFNKPSNVIVRAAYLAYLNVTGALLGWLLHRDPDTYRYIPASIRSYPGAAGVARMFEARGFEEVEWRPVLGGLMAIHIARKKR